MTIRASVTIRCDHHTETDRGDRQCMAIFTGHAGDRVRAGAELAGWLTAVRGSGPDGLDFCPAHTQDADALEWAIDGVNPADVAPEHDERDYLEPPD